MKKSFMKTLVGDLARVKSKQDIQGALEIYHPQAELVTVGLNAQAHGLLEIEQQLNIFFKIFPDYQVNITQIACNEQALLATGNVYFTPSLLDQPGKAVEQTTAFSFEFKENRISKEVFFLDFGQLCKKNNITLSQLLLAMKQHSTNRPHV